jgi:NAD(P)-dependent dehydrogenase (short-subunit alcohol dehydrogenase family)
MTSLAGRIALVTGGAEGIGLGIAQRLTGEGASVIIGDVQLAKAEAAARSMPGASARRLDVSLETDWQRLLGDDTARQIDILINNAGINLGPHPFEAYPFADWQRTLSVNLDGTFLGCRFALSVMAGRGGVIVNITSAAGRRASPGMPAYAASKAAVSTLTRSVALYCGQQRLTIRCNAVSPGSVETPMVDRLRLAQGDPVAARERARAMHPVGLVGAQADIASAVAFLVSDAARFITGAELDVDGGLSIGSG